MKKWRKWAAIGGIALLIVVAVVLSKYKPTEFETTTVKTRDVAATVTEKGKLVSGSSINVYSEVQGKITEVNFEAGEAIKKGDLLAKIDISELNSQIAQLEGDLKALQGMEAASKTNINNNQVKQQEALVEQAQVAVDFAKDAYDRVQKLYKEGAVTTVEVEQAKADVETKQKVLIQVQAALAQAKADITQQTSQKKGINLQYQGQRESLQARLVYMKSLREKANIYAPEDGIVLSKNVKKGDFAVAGLQLLSIGSSGKLSIETFVSSKDLVNIKVQDKVKVVFKSAGRDVQAQGTIQKIAPIAQEITSALGIVEDKIKVNVDLVEEPQDINLVPGITADVVLETQKAQNVIAVPKDVIFSEAGKDFVWVIKQGIAKVVQIEKGIEGDEDIEITKGLSEGDKVIINPHQKELKEGIKATAKEVS